MISWLEAIEKWLSNIKEHGIILNKRKKMNTMYDELNSEECKPNHKTTIFYYIYSTPQKLKHLFV